MKKIFNIAIIATVVLSLTSCEDFLNRPNIDSYNTGNFYQNDEQCIMGVNYLYNMPWYDFQRGFLAVGDCMAGNYFDDTQGFDKLQPAYDAYVRNMSSSLWAVVGHCSTVIDNIQASKGPSSEIKRQTIGEALVWKAFAYFFIVRAYGEVPIIHNVAEKMNEGDYNTLYRNSKENLYDYIIYTLETAEQMLPKNATPNGRIDYWAARALESKVYLTMAGVSGQLNQEYLKKAFEISKDVIDNSGRHLMPVYEEIFWGENNICEEALISWQWSGRTNSAAGWTCQNSFQNDLALSNMSTWGTDNWGHWKGVTVDLQKAFGVEAIDNPAKRADIDKDARRRATYMLPGDYYPHFWRTHGGFDPLEVCYNAAYAVYGNNGDNWGCSTGTHVCVKHCYGDNDDHVAMFGYAPARDMTSGVATHLLRLSDIYLVNAEAAILGGGDEAYGANCLNAVRRRSISGYADKQTYTFDEVWKERRLELAMEGDRWYDFVRVSYYDADYVLNRAEDALSKQYRGAYWNLEGTFKNYWKTRAAGAAEWNLEVDGNKFQYQDEHPQSYQKGLTTSVFQMEPNRDDVIFNHNIASDAQIVTIDDVRKAFVYDFSNL